MKTNSPSWRQGYKAAGEGDSLEQNIYAPSEPDHDEWAAGWQYRHDKENGRTRLLAHQRRRENTLIAA
jgi:hypothetical protein